MEPDPHESPILLGFQIALDQTHTVERGDLNKSDDAVSPASFRL